MSHKKVERIDPLTMALPAGGVDSHAHLDGPQFDADRDAVMDRAEKAGVSRFVNVFLGPEDYRERRDMFASWPQADFILGIHPCDGMRCTRDCLDEMEKCFAGDARIRAIGEIGLDFHWDDCPKELQLEVFAMQMEFAKSIAKPVVIHCREAEYDCLALLEAGGFANYPLLWHCFGGDESLARRIIRNGWHISIPGAATYKNNDALRKAAAWIPGDRLMLETDCPYLSPVPWRGTRNEPAYLVFTARAVALARNEDPATLWLKCGENAIKFFGLGQN